MATYEKIYIVLKEIDQIARKYENLVEKLDGTTEVDYITLEGQEYNVPAIIRR